MRMVQDWRSSWRWFSVQFLTLLAALPIVWLSIPQAYQDMVPAEYRMYIVIVLAVGGLAGRLVDQKTP